MNTPLRSEDIYDCSVKLTLEALDNFLPEILYVDPKGAAGACKRPTYEALRSENKALRLKLQMSEDLSEMYCQGWLIAADNIEGLEEKLRGIEVAINADLGEVC